MICHRMKRLTIAKMACSFHPFIDDYLEEMENGIQSKAIRSAAAYVRKKLSQPFVFVDAAKIERAVQLIEKYSAWNCFRGNVL